MNKPFVPFTPRLWPIALIIVGVALLLAKQGFIDLHFMRTWWPLILVAVGIRALFWPRRYRQQGQKQQSPAEPG